jgi:hypothetical protein
VSGNRNAPQEAGRPRPSWRNLQTQPPLYRETAESWSAARDLPRGLGVAPPLSAALSPWERLDQVCGAKKNALRRGGCGGGSELQQLDDPLGQAAFAEDHGQVRPFGDLREDLTARAGASGSGSTRRCARCWPASVSPRSPRGGDQRRLGRLAVLGDSVQQLAHFTRYDIVRTPRSVTSTPKAMLNLERAFYDRSESSGELKFIC